MTCSLVPVAELVAGPLDPVLVDEGKNHVPPHDDHFAGGVFKKVGIAVFDLALCGGFEERLLATLRDAADVERPHRQLRAGFTDRLRGDDADSFAVVDQRTARKVTTIAHGANALFGFAGQRRTDAHRGNARSLDRVGLALVDQFALGRR